MESEIEIWTGNANNLVELWEEMVKETVTHAWLKQRNICDGSKIHGPRSSILTFVSTLYMGDGDALQYRI